MTPRLLATLLLLSPVAGQATTDSGTGTAIYVHRATGAVVVASCDIHENSACTVTLFSPSLNIAGTSALDMAQETGQEPGDDSFEGNGNYRPLPLRNRPSKRWGLRTKCKRKTCAIYRGAKRIFGPLPRKDFQIGRINKNTFVVVVNTTTNAGAFDPKTGECTVHCMDEDHQQQALIHPPPKSVGSYRAAYAQILPKSAKKRGARHTRQGMHWYRKKQWKKAARWFQNATEYQPANVTYLVNLATVKTLQGDKAAAIALLKRAIKLNKPLTQQKMRKDSDFTRLRSDERFKRLLAQ